MRFVIILTLVTCAALASSNSNLFDKPISVADLQSTKESGNQNPPCLVNLNAGLTKCEASNKTQQQMVLIRGQLLPVESNEHGT